MNKDFNWPLMHNAITSEDRHELIDFLSNPNVRLTNGAKVREFENAWSNWLGVKHSIFVNSGASANDLTMMALAEIHGQGEVIVPPLTWVSDISSVLKAGHTPVFVDISPKSLAMDSDRIMEALTAKTKAVFLTHILGLNGLTDKLLLEIKKRKIPLIEDVCESHGATHIGKKLGTFGWASNFSFYFAHHITTIEGGMISTEDPVLHDVLRMMRSHGLVRESDLEETKRRYIADYPDLNSEFIFAYASHNMRSTELNAVLGLSQLKRLDSYIEKRRENLNVLLTNLDPRVFETNFEVNGNSNYALILILKVPSSKLVEKVEKVLESKRIEFRRGLAGGGNQLRQPYLKRFTGIPNPNQYPVTDHIHFNSWYVGNNPNLEAKMIIDLCESLTKESLDLLDV
jgi:CDP-4-dehydro-6-deoxyglucose reductase, E1